MSGEEFERKAIPVEECEGQGAWRSARMAPAKKTSANHRHERHDSEIVAYLCGLLNDDEHDDELTVPRHTSKNRHAKAL